MSVERIRHCATSGTAFQSSEVCGVVCNRTSLLGPGMACWAAAAAREPHSMPWPSSRARRAGPCRAPPEPFLPLPALTAAGRTAVSQRVTGRTAGPAAATALAPTDHRSAGQSHCQSKRIDQTTRQSSMKGSTKEQLNDCSSHCSVTRA